MSLDQMIKRLTDVLVAFELLILLSPIGLGIALLVRLSSKGPVLFRQTRIGRGGAEFVLLKFRTMHERPHAEAGSFDAGDGSRVTTIGRILRTAKLDEIPQFWNVLKGDMSLVGPRPEVRKWVETYPERWAVVHSVRPGITGPASIVYLNEEEILARSENPEATYRNVILPHKLDLYTDYLKNRSLGLDLKILWDTIVTVVFRCRGNRTWGLWKGENEHEQDPVCTSLL